PQARGSPRSTSPSVISLCGRTGRPCPLRHERGIVAECNRQARGGQMADDARLVILVHGWSVRNTNSYGELAARLRREAQRSADLRLDIRNVWLSKYVSFRNEVRLEDLARAFQNALNDAVGAELRAGRRFVCITHSTGGPI